MKPDIILVDKHQFFRQGLKFILSNENIANVIGEASNGHEFIDLLSHLHPNLVLMDIDLPEMNGVKTAKIALNMIPDLKIIAISMYGNEENYYKMISLGVKGFILKSGGINEISKAIHQVMMGKSYFSNELLKIIISNLRQIYIEKTSNDESLSNREVDILQQICQGFSPEEIAFNLNISPKTVKNYRTKLLRKTVLKTTTGLVLCALKYKMINVKTA